MARKRMFSLDIVDADNFLEMPTSSQALYFHLAMRADDDGFLASPKQIIKITNCAIDDLRVLISKGYVIQFNSGVCVIRDWKIHNTIKSDRYKPTIYTTEKALLKAEENKAYSAINTECFQNGTTLEPDWNQNGTNLEPQYSIDKISIDKYSIDNIMHGATNADSAPEPTPIVALILNDKSFYNVYQSQIDHWQELYPAVDIKQELLKMQGWLESNPTRRKTKRGIKSFITNWLSKAQDKSGNVKNEPQTQGTVEEQSKKYQSTW